MNSNFKIFLKGIIDVSPLMIPVVPFGLIFGILAIDIGFSPLATMGMSLIIFGGASLDEHFCNGAELGAAAVAAANMFHYKEMATKKVKRHLLANGFNVREQT